MEKKSDEQPIHEKPAPSRNGHHIQVLQSLRRIARAIDIHSRKLRTQYKLTTPQLVCLLATTEGEPLTATQIARQVHLSPSTVVGILDRLEAKGLIRRERDVRDRRMVNVWVTEDGRRLAEQAPTPLQDGLAEGLSDLPEPEQEEIARSLTRIVDMMEAGHISGVPILETGAVTQDEQEKTHGPDGSGRGPKETESQ
jgi:DNA-binding MarR family transcriptional regulator